jgi:hypothetical protein
MVYSYNEILLSEKESVTNSSQNLAHKHYVEWKKPETKEYMLHDPIFMTFNNW